jgi:Choline dehydrogenase and related flavoproteins
MRYFSNNLDIEIRARHVQSLHLLTVAPALQPFLQVVDASIIPLITNTNPIETVYAVVERDADIIREVCRSDMRSTF